MIIVVTDIFERQSDLAVVDVNIVAVIVDATDQHRKLCNALVYGGAAYRVGSIVLACAVLSGNGKLIAAKFQCVRNILQIGSVDHGVETGMVSDGLGQIQPDPV